MKLLKKSLSVGLTNQPTEGWMDRQSGMLSRVHATKKSSLADELTNHLDMA